MSVIRELEAGVAIGEISRKYDIHPSLPNRWKIEYYDNPENSFSGNGNTYKLEARNAELERLLGQLYAENKFLKKAIENLEKFRKEEKQLEKRRRVL